MDPRDIERRLTNMQTAARNASDSLEAAIKLHAVAARSNDGPQEGVRRAEVHAAIDHLLDLQQELVVLEGWIRRG